VAGRTTASAARRTEGGTIDGDAESELREKLRKIEALFAGAATPGERAAAGAAAERIRERLRRTQGTEALVEMQFSLADLWSRQLFLALARRYGLRPYRYLRQKRTTVMLKVPPSFVDNVLWPEFVELNAALTEYLMAVTQKIIREEVYGETTDADEVMDGARRR
jgi:hypothetical protein